MGATVKRLAQVRVMLIGIAIMLCLVFDLTFARWLSFKWGCMVLDVLGDVSAILFGVFGVWLGMFYSPTIIDSLKEKSGDNLIQAAENIVASSKRFRIVFRGMVISAVILVFAMIVRSIHVPFSQMVGISHPAIRELLRHVFFTMIACAVIAQCYSIVMSIVPMYDAKKKMSEAQKVAEITINI